MAAEKGKVTASRHRSLLQITALAELGGGQSRQDLVIWRARPLPTLVCTWPAVVIGRRSDLIETAQCYRQCQSAAWRGVDP